MTKIIVYTIYHNGIDGKDRSTVTEAFTEEEKRDEVYQACRDKGMYSCGEQIVDVDKAIERAKHKLDGIDRLMLNI